MKTILTYTLAFAIIGYIIGDYIFFQHSEVSFIDRMELFDEYESYEMKNNWKMDSAEFTMVYFKDILINKKLNEIRIQILGIVSVFSLTGFLVGRNRDKKNKLNELPSNFIKHEEYYPNGILKESGWIADEKR